MIDSLPAPLVPPEVDLRDFGFMPLDVARLRDSALIAERSAEEIVAAVLLWCASWHQVPASSLPDNEKQLSKLAGYGRGVKEYVRVKDGSLYGCILCSDGLWYHPVVAEKAAEGWNAKLKEQHKKACDRQRKANKEREARKESTLPMPASPSLLSVRQVDGIPCYRYWDSDGTPEHSSGKDTDVLRKSRLKGQGQGQGQGQCKGQGEVLQNQQRRDFNHPTREPDKPAAPPVDSKPEPETQKRVKRAVEISAMLKPLGVEITGGDKFAQDWAREDVSDSTLKQAVEIARTPNRKPAPQLIPAKYLAAIVAELRAPEDPSEDGRPDPRCIGMPDGVTRCETAARFYPGRSKRGWCRECREREESAIDVAARAQAGAT